MHWATAINRRALLTRGGDRKSNSWQSSLKLVDYGISRNLSSRYDRTQSRARPWPVSKRISSRITWRMQEEAHQFFCISLG
jgi:hypothetical protein